MSSLLQNVRPEDMSVIAVTDDNNLVRYSSSSSSEGDIIAENLRSAPFSATSISNVAENRYVFLVGGINNDDNLPSRDVFFYDLHQDWPCKRTCGPSLLGPKWRPILIVMGSKLFAVSHILCDPDPYSPWQSQPPYEILDLDTASESDWQWCTRQPFPELPPASDDGDSYNLVSYAAHESTNTLYLCLGDLTRPYTQGTLCIAYDVAIDLWDTDTHQPIPFYGEAKVFDNLFYGFPCGITARNCSSLGVYRLDNASTNINSISCWVMLRKHSLHPGISKPFRAYFPYLCVLRKDVVAIIRARFPSSFDYDESHFVEFDVVRLVKMREEDQDGVIEAPRETIITYHHSSYSHSEQFDAIVGVWCSSIHKDDTATISL